MRRLKLNPATDEGQARGSIVRRSEQQQRQLARPEEPAIVFDKVSGNSTVPSSRPTSSFCWPRGKPQPVSGQPTRPLFNSLMRNYFWPAAHFAAERPNLERRRNLLVADVRTPDNNNGERRNCEKQNCSLSHNKCQPSSRRRPITFGRAQVRIRTSMITWRSKRLRVNEHDHCGQFSSESELITILLRGCRR